jgi:hypothetical protein
MTEGVLVDLAVDESVVGDRYLLCSDGLSGMLSDDELRDLVLGAPDPDDACRELIRAANERGGEDNITAVVLVVEAQPDPTTETVVTVVSDPEVTAPTRLPMTTYPAPRLADFPEAAGSHEDTERIATHSDLPPREPTTPVPESLQDLAAALATPDPPAPPGEADGRDKELK